MDWTARGALGRRTARARPWRCSAAGLILLISACASDPDRPARNPRTTGPDAELASAREASDAGEWSLAAERWVELFESRGQHSRLACLEAARAFAAMDRMEEARALLDAGLQRHPGDPELYEIKGNVLQELGFRRAAESCYEEALRHEPGRTSALYARARLRLELGLAAAARVDLERCLQQGERGGELWLYYARALAATRQPRRAFDAFARAFELGQQDPRCLVAAAGLYLDPDFGARSEHERDLAAVWLQRAIAIEPGNAQARYGLALIQEERGELAAAIGSLARVLELDPAPLPALERLAEIHDGRGEHERAAELARKALELERRPARREVLEGFLEPPPAGAEEQGVADASTTG